VSAAAAAAAAAAASAVDNDEDSSAEAPTASCWRIRMDLNCRRLLQTG
jgi:hypothetical protein